MELRCHGNLDGTRWQSVYWDGEALHIRITTSGQCERWQHPQENSSGGEKSLGLSEEDEDEDEVKVSAIPLGVQKTWRPYDWSLVTGSQDQTERSRLVLY